MSAEVLRQAAALMRERAEAASPSPWSTDRFFWKIGSTRGLPDQFWQEVVSNEGSVCQIQEGDAADGPDVDLVHIASWHPAVALAVADLLDETAADLDALLTYGGHGPAVAVARAYLGEGA